MVWELVGIPWILPCMFWNTPCYVTQRYNAKWLYRYSRNGHVIEVIPHVIQSLPPLFIEGELWYGAQFYFPSTPLSSSPPFFFFLPFSLFIYIPTLSNLYVPCTRLLYELYTGWGEEISVLHFRCIADTPMTPHLWKSLPVYDTCLLIAPTLLFLLRKLTLRRDTPV